MSYDVQISTPPEAALIALRASANGRGAVCEALDCELPQPGTAMRSNALLAFAIARDEWLLAMPGAQAPSVLASLERALAAGGGAAAMISDAYACLRVTGADTGEVMAQVVPIDLHPDEFPVDSTRRTAFGRSSALVHRIAEPPGFDIYVDSTVARYAARLLATCSGQPLKDHTASGGG